MIRLEEQIRRYATDVAGPAVAAPPVDLDAVSRPRHRGRWALVAALVIFIAGLTWVATRPSDLSEAPTTGTVPTQLRELDSHQIRSATPCGPTGRIGTWFGGPAGDGMCLVPVNGWELRPDDQATYLELVADGELVTTRQFEPCSLTTWIETGTGTGVDGSAVFIAVAEAPAASVRFDEPDGGVVTAELVDLPGVDGLRFAVARLRPGYAGAAYFDEAGRPVQDDPSTGTSIANCGIATSDR